jgi:hypothetical protein
VREIGVDEQEQGGARRAASGDRDDRVGAAAQCPVAEHAAEGQGKSQAGRELRQVIPGQAVPERRGGPAWLGEHNLDRPQAPDGEHAGIGDIRRLPARLDRVLASPDHRRPDALDRGRDPARPFRRQQALAERPAQLRP